MPSASGLLPVLAQALESPAPGGGGGDGTALLKTVLMMAMIFGIFWFLIIRPQQKQEKLRRAMLEALKKKDRILTSGGILGTVSDIRDDEVTVRICENPDVKIRIRRSAVAEVVQETAEPAAK